MKLPLRDRPIPPLPFTTFARKAGWLLMEVVVALGLFSAAVVSFVVALNRTAELSMHAQTKSHVARLIEGALMEASTEPEMREVEYEYDLSDQDSISELLGMKLEVTTEQINLKNKDDMELKDMWLIRVKATWSEDGVPYEEELETWRYEKLYQL